jgi:hypothetical protein
MSDGEFEDSFSEVNPDEENMNEDDESSEVIIKSQKINQSELKPLKRNTHFLPFRIPYTGQCNTNVYFDSLIEPRRGSNPNSDEYITSFRGKFFNGKKIKVADQKFNLIKINQTNHKGSNKINKLEEIDEYYIWKFDEEIPYDNNLLNMSNILKSLDILK